MKFAELVVRAGFPPGVVNILPGKGLLAMYMYVYSVHCIHSAYHCGVQEK